MTETLYGRSIEAVLISPYFGLDSLRPPESPQRPTHWQPRLRPNPVAMSMPPKLSCNSLPNPTAKLRSGEQKR